nr:uncharacterized protein LOC106678990 [Halyomorpha halys]
MVCFKYLYTRDGGYITIINETDSDWVLIEQQSYYMNFWNFPNLIKTQSISHIYVEWSRKLFIKNSNKLAIAIYSLVEDREKEFVIQANDFNIAVFFHNISLDGMPGNSIYNLGWVQNGDVTFVLVEYLGRFTGTSLNATDWMKNNLDFLGTRTLKELCIPGTHNSGMSFLYNRTFFSHPCNTLTQSHTIKEQLHFGIRYFDIRPILKQGEFRTGHYERIPGSWQGGVGQSIKSIVEEINEFTNSHCEVIIITLSHSLNTDLKNNKFQEFNQSEWDRLFHELDKIDNLYHALAMEKLSELTIDELTKKGKTSAVIIVLTDMRVVLNQRWGKGYFYTDSIDIYDVYSNTNKLKVMVSDQIMKMALFSRNYYFLLSWTLTQNFKEAILCQTRGINGIKNIAKEANSHLAYILYPQISSNSYPNIICIDDVKNTEVTTLALAINKKLI